MPDGAGRWSNDREQRGTHLLDGVIKLDVVLCDFTFEMFQVFRIWRKKLLCSDVFMVIESSKRFSNC